MDSYKDYLAANVLQENRPITFKLLSRALKVHVQQAKKMLYHFHATQNAKKPGSVHATYIVTGTKNLQPADANHSSHAHNDDDVPMRSSPFPSSLPDAPPYTEEAVVKVTAVTLTREEDLDHVKAQYDEITSIHVYSLEQGPLKDLQLLSDCSREIAAKFLAEVPPEPWKTYGIIHNPHVWRRTGTKPTPPAAPVATNAAAKTAPRASSAAFAKQKEAQDASKSSRATTSQGDAGKKADKKAPALKKEASSIFASFAKAQPKKKAVGSGTSTPAADSAEPSAAEDEPMKDADDDEGEEDDVIFTGSNKPKDPKESKEAIESARKARAEREEKLRKMMEDDDDDVAMQDAPSDTVEEPEEPTIDQPSAPKPEPEPEKQETVTVSNGRRRGRRRVMKKKTVKDEEGYLVTKEEAVWESFSEDEPEPKKLKPSTTTTSKAKKGAAKQGQGSIMSFFAKKPA